MLKYSKNGNWRSYWGQMPLPDGAEALGTVSHNERTGALIRLSSDVYIMGNIGGIRNLPQNEVIGALAMSAHLSRAGSVRSERKAQTSAENGRKNVSKKAATK